MIGLARTISQVIIARILAGPLGAWAHELLAVTQMTEERLADWLTVVVIGLGAFTARTIKATSWGAKLIEWANLILSFGQSAVGPAYQPRHARTDG